MSPALRRLRTARRPWNSKRTRPRWPAGQIRWPTSMVLMCPRDQAGTLEYGLSRAWPLWRRYARHHYRLLNGGFSVMRNVTLNVPDISREHCERADLVESVA
jgi:hypothetical protein